MIALDRLGIVVRFAGGQVTFPQSTHAISGQPFTPVAAFDPSTGRTLTLYRDAQSDQVSYLDSHGNRGTFPGRAWGKWSIAIALAGPGTFRAAILDTQQVNTVSLYAFLAQPDGTLTVQDDGDRAIEQAQVLIELSPDGSLRLDNTDAGYDARTFTRAGVSLPLLYWSEEHGRVIGIDGRPGPNQVLLGDVDGWYLVTDRNSSALFPPRLDMNGNAATWDDDYWTNADIRSRPIVQDPTIPVPPPVALPVVYTSDGSTITTAPTSIANAIRAAVQGIDVDMVIVFLGVLAAVILVWEE